jgi:hypothetical protein
VRSTCPDKRRICGPTAEVVERNLKQQARAIGHAVQLEARVEDCLCLPVRRGA